MRATRVLTASAASAASAARRVTRSPDLPLILAVVLVVLAVVEAASGTVNGPAEPGLRDPRLELGQEATDPTLAVLLAACGTAPVALMRVSGLTAAGLVAGANGLALASGPHLTVAAVLAQVITVYVVARSGPAWVVPLLLLPSVACWLLLMRSQRLDQGDAALVVVASAFAGMAGIVVTSRNHARAHRRTADAVADSQLEHAVRGERARIARELHDVVAHHISLISIQAETARLTTPGMPAEGARRLSDIGGTAREALTEMRRLLNVLREDAETAPARAPQPGLPQLVDLVDEARTASGGACTRLLLHGPVKPLDPGIELTAYRIVQEALTNARRHAPGAAVDVELDFRGEVVHLRVRDNGPGVSDAGSEGHGLLGMRERVAMVGGALTTGPAPSAGFEVLATLPVTGTTP